MAIFHVVESQDAQFFYQSVGGNNIVFYRVPTAITSASKKEDKTRKSLDLTKFVRFVALDISSLI